MRSISGSPRRARAPLRGGRAAAALAAAALAILPASCFDNGERDGLPSLVLAPDSALQGATLTVLMSATDYKVSQCAGISAASLEFSFSGAPSTIQTSALTLLDDETLRAQLFVPLQASIGVHNVVFHCDTRTALHGQLTIRERVEDGAITLDPPEAKAGTFYQRIDIASEDVAFDAEQSHVIFGDGSYITVSDTVIVDGEPTMRVFVDIPPLTPVGEMEVAVVTGDLVARGTFGILTRDTPWIEVDPDYTVLTGTSTAAQTTHTITGTSVAFVEIPDDADAGADGGTVVGFPENPGLTVTRVEVDDLDPSIMSIDVAAAQGTALGTTPLTVRTGGPGGETVSAAFTVYPTQEEEAFLTLSPPRVERGAHAAAVVVHGSNIVPITEEILSGADPRFAEEGCVLERAELLSEDELSLAVSVSGDCESDVCTLLLGSGDSQLAALLAVVAPERYMATSLGAIAQDAGGMFIVVSAIDAGGVGPAVFNDETTASVSPRSGVKILSQQALDEKRLLINFDAVAPDAPLGPARLYVETHDGSATTDYTVLPSVSTSQNVAAIPRSVPAEERDVVWRLQSVATGDTDGEQLLFDAGAPPEVEWDNPAIRTKSISVVDSRNATVRASLGPGIESDMAVMYVTSGGAKAAASVLLEPSADFIVQTAEPELVRGVESQIAFVEVLAPGGAFVGDRPVVGEIYDGIGARVLSADLYPDDGDFDTYDELYLQIQVDATGPSGWFGAVLTDGRRSAVVPLHIAGEPDTLTMPLDVESTDGALRRGDRDVAIEVVLPSVAPITWILSDARVGVPAVRARLTGVDGSAVRMSVDVSADAEGVNDLIPIYVITGEGASVAFVPFVAAETAILTMGEETVFYLDDETTPVGLVSTYPEDALAWVSLDYGRPGRNDADAELLAQDLLSVQGASGEGVVWLYETEPVVESLLVRPVGSATAGLPTALRLGSFGDAVGAESEDGDDDLEEPDPLGDPCAAPSLTAATIGFPLDEDWFDVTASSGACDAVFYVVARDLGARPWSTPDVLLELREAASSAALVDRSVDWKPGGSRDPRIYFHLAPGVKELLRVAPELGSAGQYFLHARRGIVIREVCRADGGDAAYVEIEAAPGADLGKYSLQLVDPETSAVLAELDLSGAVPGDGIVVVAEGGFEGADVADTTGVTEVPAGQPFAVRLAEGTTPLDAVQVDGAIGYGEGEPASGEGDPLCWSRLAGIDTNRNDSDFIALWTRSPGG